MIQIDENQLLLLKSLFPENGDPLPFYNCWRRSICFDALDGGSFRLIPMLYKRLESTAERDDLFDRLKGIYRYTLYRNSLTLSRFHVIARTLHDKGIRTLLLKGGALLHRYYDDPGLRPMNDIDIFVDRENAAKAISILKNLGWKYVYNIEIDNAVKIYRSTSIISEQGFEVDIHWDIMYEYGGEVSAQELWDQSMVVEVRGVPFHILSPEDQILHTCAHGVKWNTLSPIRWIPDLIAIFRLEFAAICWDDVLLKAQRRNLTLSLQSCLDFVQSHFDYYPIGDVVSMLSKIEISRSEQNLFRFYTSPPLPRTFCNRLRTQWLLYNCDNRMTGWVSRLIYFVPYLKYKSGIQTNMACLRYLVELAIRGVINRLHYDRTR